jgi:hypothetical protein
VSHRQVAGQQEGRDELFLGFATRACLVIFLWRVVRMQPRVASPKVNTTLVLRNRGAGEQVDRPRNRRDPRDDRRHSGHADQHMDRLGHGAACEVLCRGMRRSRDFRPVARAQCTNEQRLQRPTC